MEKTCTECGTEMPLEVLKSGGGFYLGHWCGNCGPYDRASQYFGEREEAERYLENLKENL
jgi:uncharacterized Zn finger protein